MQVDTRPERELCVGLGDEGCTPRTWTSWVPGVDEALYVISSDFLRYAIEAALSMRPFMCYAVPSRTGGPQGLPVKGGFIQLGAAFRSRTGEASCADLFVAPVVPPLPVFAGPDEVEIDFDEEDVELGDLTWRPV